MDGSAVLGDIQMHEAPCRHEMNKGVQEISCQSLQKWMAE